MVDRSTGEAGLTSASAAVDDDILSVGVVQSRV